MMSELGEYADTDATRMLASAFRVLQEKEGLSLRKLAPRFGYNQATVLSQMLNGRIKVPIAKAADIAQVLGLQQSDFLIAVMEQHQKEPEHQHFMMASAPLDFALPESFSEELADLALGSLDNLTTEQKEVMRKVVQDPNPARRWLSEAEIPTIQLVRRLRPDSQQRQLSARDRARIRSALEAKSD